MEESHKATALKKAYAEIILNTAKESAARVMVSDRKSARFHHDLSETKNEAFRLLVRLKHMIDAKTIEAEVISSSQQRQIDVLEAQLHEAEDIITDLRSEVTWVRDRLEKAKAYESQERNLVNVEEETVSVHEVAVVESLVPDQEDRSSLDDVDCENEEKQFDDGLSVNTYETPERKLVNMEEETVSVHKVYPEVVLESLNSDQDDPSSLHDIECENLEKAKASESQERNLVNKEEGTVFVHEVVVESLNPDQEVADTCFFVKTLDVKCENDEKHFDLVSVNTLQAYESQGRNAVNMEEEETVSVHKVYPEVVLESLKPDQEDHSSLDAVECDNLEKAKASESQERNLVNIEEEMVSIHEVDPEVGVEYLNPNQEVADTCKIHEVECENDDNHLDGLRVVDTSMGNDVCESELDGDIRIKKLELSRNGCTQRIHALERKSSSSADEEEQQGTTEKETEESLSSGKATVTLGNTRCLVHKPKAKPVRTQSQLIKPCQSQSQSNATCSKTSISDGEDSVETHLSVESKCQESNLVSINVEEADIPESGKTEIKPLPRLTSRKEDVLLRCEGEEDSLVPSTKMATESKVTAVASHHISESTPRANVNRLLKYTFQRKRKRGSANINEDSNNLPRKQHQGNEVQYQIESTLK